MMPFGLVVMVSKHDLNSHGAGNVLREKMQCTLKWEKRLHSDRS